MLGQKTAVCSSAVLDTGQSSSQNNQSSIVSPPMEERRAETPQHSDPDIIGTKEFEFDDQVLDDYLTDIMKWWNGARPSRGVSLEQSGRCLYAYQGFFKIILLSNYACPLQLMRISHWM